MQVSARRHGPQRSEPRPKSCGDTVCDVPQRTNVFQEIVTIVHEHLAGDARVERSGYLRHRVTGRKREVDAVIRSKIAGHELIVSVEATGVENPATARPVDVGWVEECIEKHRNLPTSKLVLVSESGFTDAARKQAEHEEAVPLTPEDLDADDPAYAVMTALPSLWPKEVTLEPETATVLLGRSDDAQPLMTNMNAPLAVYLDDGRRLRSLRDLLKLLFDEHFDVFAETLHLDAISEDTTRGFTFTMRGAADLFPWTLAKTSICIWARRAATRTSVTRSRRSSFAAKRW
jgi:hypothetical protein